MIGPVPGLIALVETPRGISALPALARVPAVVGLALGTEDFSLALGVPPEPAVLDFPSRQLALAAAERGLMALAVPVSIAQFRDMEAYAAAVDIGAAYGINGAICIHPSQVAVANRGFGVTAEERAVAERIVAAWDEATGRGASVTSLDGRMIDAPVVERARRLLSRSVGPSSKGD